MPTDCSVCCRQGITNGFARIFTDCRWSTGSPLPGANKPIEFVYFIESGVGSLVNTMANGDAAEVGTIGNEGVVGLPLCWATIGRPPAFTSRSPAPACE